MNNTKSKGKDFLVKYTMIIIMVIVFLFFNYLTGGRMTYAQNLSNLLLQNAYVVILACGMLLCILTGGNIDLAVGSVVCLVGAIAAQLFAKTSLGAIPVIIIGLLVGLLVGVWQGWICKDSSICNNTCRYVCIPWNWSCRS